MRAHGGALCAARLALHAADALRCAAFIAAGLDELCLETGFRPSHMLSPNCTLQRNPNCINARAGMRRQLLQTRPPLTCLVHLDQRKV